MKKPIDHSPLLLPTLFFLIGLIIAFCTPIHTSFFFWGSAAVICSVIFLRRRKKLPFFQTILILLLFLFLGMLRLSMSLPQSAISKKEAAILHVEILEVINPHSFLVSLPNTPSLNQNFNLHCEPTTSLFTGDELTILGIVSPLPSLSALKSFNPQSFFNSKNCYAQIEAVRILVQPHQPKLSTYFAQAQHDLANVFNRFLSDSSEAGIMKALVLGNTQDLSFESKTQFANAGISHILAVSGMHVALVYQLVKAAMNALFRRKRRKGLYLLIGATAVWTFAAITGFSASVTRAAFMMTFFVVIDAMQWRYAKTNVVAGSILLLGVYDPFLFKQLGFQLSLAAVLGILYIYPKVKFHVSKRKWVQFSVDFCLVSLVAQVATLPITLLTFHTFPTYFLLANIICVPLSTALIYAGIALLCLSSIPLLNHAIAELIHTLLYFFNETVQHINQLPLLKLTNIPFNATQTLLFLLGLTCFIVAFEYRWKVFSRLALTSITFALAFQYRSHPPLLETMLIEDQYHVHLFVRSNHRLPKKLMQLTTYLETNRIHKSIEVHLIPPYHTCEIST